jgi:hypothetical protein
VKLSDICEQVTALNVGLEMSYPEWSVRWML